MEDAGSGCLGVLTVLALFVLGIGALSTGLYMFLTEKVILYSEQKIEWSSPMFKCHYFTGLKTVEVISSKEYGCRRFIDRYTLEQ